MAPTLEEMRLACDTLIDSDPFEKPIASNAPTSSPARSDGSEVYTQEELEAYEDSLEKTSYSAHNGRPPSSKPKPPSGSGSSSTEEGEKEQTNDPNPNHSKSGKGKEKPPQSEEDKRAMILERKKAAATANARIQKKIDDKEVYLTTGECVSFAAHTTDQGKIKAALMRMGSMRQTEKQRSCITDLHNTEEAHKAEMHK